MKVFELLAVGRLLVALGLLVPAGPPGAAETPAQAGGRPTSTPVADSSNASVVVELFTSEGCSSCPPADRSLARLADEQPVHGVEIIAVGQHVDYWNRLGWSDPYSSPLYTTRQQEYAVRFGQSSVYTPQMVVDGREEFVGGDQGRVLEAIRRAARTPKAAVELRRAGERATSAGLLTLRVTISKLPRRTPGATADVILALTERDLVSDVRRGENAGRSLAHGPVARKMMRIGTIGPGAPEPVRLQARVELSPTWVTEKLDTVIFVQERRSGSMLGSSRSRLHELQWIP